MPFRKRSIREQRRMARELRRLEQFERTMRNDYAGTSIAQGPLNDVFSGAVGAALDLGYVIKIVRVNGSGSQFRFRALRVE